MAGSLCERRHPQLQFERAADNKGVLIVGNYGTGKCHLMSLISASPNTPMRSADQEQERRERRRSAIAGKFKVVRLELGCHEESLRNIICGRLEDFSPTGGSSSRSLPTTRSQQQGRHHRSDGDCSSEKYPDQGLLLVVDELLDYLRARNDQDLILDLGFLREIGEVCKLIRFRFMAGLAGEPVRQPEVPVRRRERCAGSRTASSRSASSGRTSPSSSPNGCSRRRDEQKAWIGNHLQKFTPLYGGMAERLDEFVRLFPVHPAYVATFEKVYVAEKREVLKTSRTRSRRCSTTTCRRTSPASSATTTTGDPRGQPEHADLPGDRGR